MNRAIVMLALALLLLTLSPPALAMHRLQVYSTEPPGCPVKVLRASAYIDFDDGETDTYVKVRNIGDKKIAALEFEWTPRNSFGDPIRSFTTDKTLASPMKPRWKERVTGKSLAGGFGAKDFLMRVTRVKFTDGSVWKPIEPVKEKAP